MGDLILVRRASSGGRRVLGVRAYMEDFLDSDLLLEFSSES